MRFTPENIGGTDCRWLVARRVIRPIHGHAPFVPQRVLFVPRRGGPTARNRTVTDNMTVDGRQSAVGSRSPQSESAVRVASLSRQSESAVRVGSPSRQSESSVRVVVRVVGRVASPSRRSSASPATDSDSRSTARESVAASPTLGVGSPTLWSLDSRPLKMADWDLATRTDDSDWPTGLRLPTVTEDCD